MLALSVAIKRYIGANGASTLPPPISERKRSKTELQTKMRKSAPSFLIDRVSANISRRHDEACHTETCPHRQHSIAGRVYACQVKHAAAQHIRSQGCQKALRNAVEPCISRVKGQMIWYCNYPEVRKDQTLVGSWEYATYDPKIPTYPLF